MHEDDKIDNDTGDAYKPEVVTTKLGIDVVDHYKSIHSVARITCRWPMRIFLQF